MFHDYTVVRHARGYIVVCCCCIVVRHARGCLSKNKLLYLCTTSYYARHWKLFFILQRWEPFRKRHHIQIGASIPLWPSLLSATHQSKVLWGVWCLHETESLREASVYLLLSELGGHGKPLLDQTVHWGMLSTRSLHFRSLDPYNKCYHFRY